MSLAAGLRLAVRSRDCATPTPPTSENQERPRGRLLGTSAIRAAKQQAGSSPVTAEAKGSRERSCSGLSGPKKKYPKLRPAQDYNAAYPS